jgi:hypothetical protein
MECHGKTFLLWKQRADGCESTLNFFQTHFEDMLRLPCNPVSWEELLGLFYQRLHGYLEQCAPLALS